MLKRALGISVLAVLLSASTGWAISLVEAEWLRERLDDKALRIVDVSNKADAYAKGHIPGAVQVKRYLDLGNTDAVPPTLYPTKGQLEGLMSRLGVEKGTTVVAYDDALGLFASRLLVIMEYYGHDTSRLKLLNGGTVRWKAVGYPWSTDPVAVKPTRYRVRDDEIKRGMIITWGDIYRDVVQGARPDILLLDVRPAAEFTAKNIRSIRGGHVPKAINVTGADANKKEDHTFKPPTEIRRMYEEKGVGPDQPVYVYCHSGDRAAHAFITLKYLLGYRNVKLYDGGWTEWSTILSLPAAGQIWLWEAPKEEKKQ